MHSQAFYAASYLSLPPGSVFLPLFPAPFLMPHHPISWKLNSRTVKFRTFQSWKFSHFTTDLYGFFSYQGRRIQGLSPVPLPYLLLRTANTSLSVLDSELLHVIFYEVVPKEFKTNLFPHYFQGVVEV